MTENGQRETTDWKRMSFKGNKVWAALDENGDFLEKDGKITIKYNLDQNYTYRVKKENLRPEKEAVKKGGAKGTKTKNNIKNTSSDTGNQIVINENEITVFTDGASSGNPGPAGIGIYMKFRDKEKKVSESIGTATNNVAELTAIKKALELIRRTDIPVRLYTDSSYCQGVLVKGWKAKENTDLILSIKKRLSRFADLKILKVKGHAGIKENEIADTLATDAVK
ncbi:MAG: ribonuclease HI [Thermodesulfobacteriota bacterium]